MFLSIYARLLVERLLEELLGQRVWLLNVFIDSAKQCSKKW